MNDGIDKYLNKSKKNLCIILHNLEINVEFLENNLWDNNDDFKDILNNVIEIYYDKYYLYSSNDFSKIERYIKFNNKINRKLKNILLSIIEYYESINMVDVLKEKEGSILYLTILIYVGTLLYDKDFYLIDTPKKIEKVINNVLDNFQSIRFKRNKDLISFIENIKDIILENNRFNNIINDLSNINNHNYFIRINKENNYYKVIYEYNISELNDYENKDISIVNDKMKIASILTGISYDLAYYTSFKLLKNGIDAILLFKLRKEDLLDKSIRDYLINRNNLVNSKIKFLIDYENLEGNYEFINLMKANEIDIYIEVNSDKETNNYNMFMDIKNVIVSEEFLSINEKYLEIWKDMNMNFIIKNLGSRIDEKSLLSRK